MTQIQDSYVWMKWIEDKRSKQKQERIQQQQIQQQQQQNKEPSTASKMLRRIRNPQRRRRLGENIF